MANLMLKFVNVFLELDEIQVSFFTYFDTYFDSEIELILKATFPNYKSIEFTGRAVKCPDKNITPHIFMGDIYLKSSQINVNFIGMAKTENSVQLENGTYTNLQMICMYNGDILKSNQSYEKGSCIIGSYLIKHYEYSWKFYKNESAIKSLTDKLYNSYVHDFGICSEEMALEYLKSMTGIDFIQSKKPKQKKDGTFQMPVKNVWIGELKDDLVPCIIELTYRYFKIGVHVEVGWSLDIKPIGIKDFIIY
jgi:hypothetical protein